MISISTASIPGFWAVATDFSIIGGTPTIVEDAASGTDLIEIRNNVPSFVLPDNVENLFHVFFLGDFKGTGNELDNLIYGGVDRDTLIGLDGVTRSMAAPASTR